MKHPHSTMRRVMATTVATLLATLPCIAPAQNIPRQPTADSTHTYRNWGRPQGTDEACNAGFVRSGGQCVALNTGAGATLLPYTMPAGTYFNSAPYPLLLTVTPPGPSCYDFSVYVDGQFMAQARDDCERSNTSVTVLVPANNSFGITGGNTRVTALSSNATWQATGINFDYYAGATSINRVSGDCAWTDYTTRWVNIYTGVTRQVTTQLYYQCYDNSGGGQ